MLAMDNVQIKIKSGWPMGMMVHHEGKTYDAVRVTRGYKLTPKAVSYVVIHDKWIRAGHAEVVDPEPEDIFV